jgi:hypothetical protein
MKGINPHDEIKGSISNPRKVTVAEKSASIVLLQGAAKKSQVVWKSPDTSQSISRIYFQCKVA